jgi:hypothetical protein
MQIAVIAPENDAIKNVSWNSLIQVIQNTPHQILEFITEQNIIVNGKLDVTKFEAILE